MASAGEQVNVAEAQSSLNVLVLLIFFESFYTPPAIKYRCRIWWWAQQLAN
jgi:hypothetical protein